MKLTPQEEQEIEKEAKKIYPDNPIFPSSQTRQMQGAHRNAVKLERLRERERLRKVVEERIKLLQKYSYADIGKMARVDELQLVLSLLSGESGTKTEETKS